MNSDYRKELEKITRQMILIHRADVLIKLVLRTIVRDMGVRHAGMFIYDRSKDAYIAKVSRGSYGFKIPAGFVKIKKENPIVKYFTDKKFSFCGPFIMAYKVETLLRSNTIKHDRKAVEFLSSLSTNLNFYQAKVCIPGFFRNELLGVLFLGDKNSGGKFSARDLSFLSVLAGDIVMALKNAWLFENLNDQIEANKRLFLQMVSALVSSIEAKDQYTKGHTERVMQYSIAIARKLPEYMDPDRVNFVEDLRVAALLHDVGKIGIPEGILNKPGALSSEEMEVVKRHPVIGEDILKSIESLDIVRMGVKYHHERCDGQGYPYGLKGTEIPLVASVISLADAYDAMTTDRPYRTALTKEEAIAEIKRNRGKQFCAEVVDAFLDILTGKDDLIESDEES